MENAFELLLQELRELRMAVSELNAKTDSVINEVSGMSLRVDKLKLNKLIVEKLEVEGLELQLRFAGGADNDC